MRIGRNVAKRLQKNYTMCKIRQSHNDPTPGMSMFHHRSLNDSILWTTVRDPTKRAMSAFFFFRVSREGIPPTDENFKKSLKQERKFSTRQFFKRHKNTTKRDIYQVMNAILHDYNFIAITERMNESIVALMMLLHLTISDVLYLSAKTTDGYDDGTNV
jgi:hypothetical protein